MTTKHTVSPARVLLAGLLLLGIVLAAASCASDDGPDPGGPTASGEVEGPDPGDVEAASAEHAHGELSARDANGNQITDALDPGDPVNVSIPAIDVDSELVRLGLTRSRDMEVPEDFGLAGWYVHAPQPGDVGPAVIAGHVSSSGGPAVFYRLSQLETGDEVHVTRDDGERVTFVIDRVEQHPKDDFPTHDVYGDTDEPELRLITCGGEFDRDARSHRDNIIAYASKR